MIKNSTSMIGQKMSAVLRLRSVGFCAKRTSLAVGSVSGQKSERGSAAVTTKAVVFDMGGVIIPSPLPFLRDYESNLGLPAGTLAKTVVSGGDNGAWQEMERGEISLSEFAQKFSQQVAAVSGRKQIDLSQMMNRLAESLDLARPFPEMLDAIQCLRAEGIKTALLTNNSEHPNGGTCQPLDEKLFDVIVESAKVKMRKPEPRIYQYTLEKLQVAPQETVFLDNLGENLKAAKKLGFRTVKVTKPCQAIKDLEREVGFQLNGYVDGTTRIPDQLKISFDRLKSYLNSVLNLHDTVDPVIRYFEHGLSNPTYFVKYANKDMVLRKKPPGKLLPSAHSVEREYLVMKSLKDRGVPLPTILGFCEDSSILGTPFYVMEYVPGRIFKDPLLPGLSNDERRAIYLSMCDVLVRIHKVSIKEAGLENFGKQGGFVKRNFNRWAKQYEASKTRDIPAMDDLMKWLTENMPAEEACTVIHGDFRLDNLIFHPSKPEVLAVIDWELSTLGDPLVDLANECLKYYIHTEKAVLPNLQGVDVQSYGIPTVEELIKRYSEQMEIPGIADKWPFYMAFICFRGAAMLQGVHMRYSLGQSSSPNTEMAGPAVDMFASLGLEIAFKQTLLGGKPHNTNLFGKTSGGSKKFSTLASCSASSSVEPSNTSGYSERNINTGTSCSDSGFRIPSVRKCSTALEHAIPGGTDLCQETELLSTNSWAQVLSTAHGPDEVHYHAVAKMKIHIQNMAKL